MSAFMAYLIKSAILVAVFYLFYLVFLRNETFFRFNRYYFLAGMILSLLLPLADMAAWFHVRESVPVQFLSHGYGSLQQKVVAPLPATPAIREKADPLFYFLLIYLAGVVLLLVRLLMQVFTLFLRIRKADMRRIDGVRLITDRRVRSPFSFFGWVFVHPEQLKEKSLEEVLLHEKEHIRQRHSLDLLLAELITVFQWPSPFVWMLSRSLKETHEYLADRAVLRQGIPPEKYQRTLIGFILGAGNPALITPLNFSFNQKRIMMMKKMRSPNRRKWRSLLVLPVVFVAGIAFSPAVSGLPGQKESSGNPSFTDPVRKERVSEYKVSGKVVHDDSGKPMPGVNIVIVNTTVGAVSGDDGTFTLPLDREQAKVAFSFVGYKTETVTLKNGEHPVIRMKKIVTVIDPARMQGVPREKTSQPAHPTARNKTGEIFFVVEDMPRYTGEGTLQQYIGSHLRVPVKAKKKKISGTVYVNFTVDENGRIRDVYVDPAKRLDPALDKEAVRVISGMPPWKPAVQRGRKVPVELSVPVTFK